MASNKNSNVKSILLWTATILLGLGLLSVRIIVPELLWLTGILAALLVGALGFLIHENRKALKGRTMAYGAQSIVTVLLVVGIVGVLNFLVSQHPWKKDFTAGKVHTLSEDTAKLMTGLKNPVKATLYAKISDREHFRPMLDNYKSFNPPKFEIEYVDPDREPLRVRENGIKRNGTLQLQVNGKESKVEELTEEKVTNALLKLMKNKTATLCMVNGHGEKSFTSNEADGISAVKKSLEDQQYTLKEFNLVQDGKSISTCDAVAIVGPTKAFFAPEVQTLKEYLENGGRALLALDLNIKGMPYATELDPILAEFYLKRLNALVVDPFAQAMGGDAAMPLVSKYSTESPITKDFHERSFFPFMQPIEIESGAPAGLKVNWLAQTMPQAWGITDLKALQKGQVASKKDGDRPGPLNAGAFVDGKLKDSKATKNTRLAVFGTSFFATNNFSRFGGNMDLFINSVSWLLEDESFISIHPKEEPPSKLELTATELRAIGVVNMGLLPLATLITGIAIWFRRRRL